jgi:hypothetical protein
MSTTMTALDSSSIRYAEFIRLTLPSNTYTFCNAAAPITVNGITFTNLGSLLQISDIKRDVKANSSDLNISLTGVDGTNVAIVLSSDIKGSRIEIWRGFLDSNNQIITSPTQQFFKRYQGIVSNYSITEDWNEQARTRVATVGLSCASFRTILENRVGGVRTTPKIWQAFYPNDTSMNRVPSIAGSYFDFGGQPTTGSQSVTQAPSQKRFGL